MRRCLFVILWCIPISLLAQNPLAPADSALQAGEPWRASQLMAPLLASPVTRTPDAVILAAQAAAAWEGWATVRTLLEHETWLDDRFDRAGRLLLAEADLADNRNPDAVVQALDAVAADSGRSDEEQGGRLVVLARAYDRLGQLDSAAAVYRRAMHRLPELADWLALRTAGVTRDSAARAQLYAGVALPAATPRIPWTEALARERIGDYAGAAVAYTALGARVAALRVHWLGALSDSARRLVASNIATLLADPSTSAAEARAALDLVDTINPPFTPDDQLAVARRAAAVNRASDAIVQFTAAARDSTLTARDRIVLAGALGDLQRWSDAADELAGIRDPLFAGQAAYFRARALLRSNQTAAAQMALRQVVRRYPHDTLAAATALHLLADLAVDSGRVTAARQDYLQLAARYPSNSQHGYATLMAALIELARHHPLVTVRELARALTRHTAGAETDAARYWLGRARWTAHDTTHARADWRMLLARGPENYYAVRAAARLDTVPWPPIARAVLAPPDSLNGILARARLLDGLGLDVEAKFERDRIVAQAHGTDAERVGEVFLVQGFMSRAIQLANRAVAAGAPRDAIIWQMLYPLPFASTLRAIAVREQLDPYLVASIIRQESNFEPHATSRTNARGLMQVEPATGRDLAHQAGIADFDPASLWIAPVNLALGMHHFATTLARYPELERGVAAYNAGVSRVDQWSMSPLDGKRRSADHARDAVDDIEMFVERIPFVETRDYVRAIVRNAAMYRMIYGGAP
jgi:soluble lytic murein transglycosylase